MNETLVEVDTTDSKTPVIAAVFAASLTILLPYHVYITLYPSIKISLFLSMIWGVDSLYILTILNAPDVFLMFLIPIGSFQFLFTYGYYCYYRGSYSFKKLIGVGFIVQVPTFLHSLIILLLQYPYFSGFFFPTPFMVVLCLLLAKTVGGPRGAIPNTE